MVSKCANPACSTPFHYMREGKIFRVEVEVTPQTAEVDKIESSNGKKVPFVVPRTPNRKVEHFWLCGPCSRTMNLLFDRDRGVSVLPKPHIPLRAMGAVAAS